MNYYKILSIQLNATTDEIKKAYKSLAMVYHPDKNINKSPEEIDILLSKFKQINKAYEVLSDPFLRKNYDNCNYNDFNYSDFNFNYSDYDPMKTFNKFFNDFYENLDLSDNYKNVANVLHKTFIIKNEDNINFRGFNDVNISKLFMDILNVVEIPINTDFVEIKNKLKKSMENHKNKNNLKENVKSPIKSNIIIVNIHSSMKNIFVCKKKNISFTKKFADLPEQKFNIDFNLVLTTKENPFKIIQKNGDIIHINVNIHKHELYKSFKGFSLDQNGNLIKNVNIALYDYIFGVKFKLRHIDNRILLIKIENVHLLPQIQTKNKHCKKFIYCILGEGMPCINTTRKNLILILNLNTNSK